MAKMTKRVRYQKYQKKAEIATFLTLGLVIVGALMTVAVSVFTNQKKLTSKPKASSCSVVSNVSQSPSTVAAGQTFTCSATTDGTSPYTIACGISKNGEWPLNMLSGSCSGRNCSFQVKMEDQVDSNAIYELVAFDFRTECGPVSGKRAALTVQGVNQQQSGEGCQGKTNGYVIDPHTRMDCDTNIGRYVIIDKIC